MLQLIPEITDIRQRLGNGSAVIDQQYFVPVTKFEGGPQALDHMLCLALGILQQHLAPGGSSYVGDPIQSPQVLFFLQPANRVWMALDPAKNIQNDLFQRGVIPSRRHGIHQRGKFSRFIQIFIAAVQKVAQHPGHQHMAFSLVAQAKITVQAQFMAALPQNGRAQSVNGGDMCLMHQRDLAAQMGITGLPR